MEANRFREEYFGDRELKEPYVRQFTIGIDHVLPGQIPLGAHYIYRRFGNILEDIGTSEFQPLPFVNPVTGETITVYDRLDPTTKLLLTNPSGLFRRYHGLEFFANKRFGNDFSVMGSFVYSRLTGNSPGDNGFGGANTPFLDSPNSLINFPGRLANDPTIAWKVVGTYALPWGFNTGWYFRHETGDTWAARVRVNVVTNFRNLIILGETAGSRRLPSQNLLDMRVEKQFSLHDGQLRFTVDVFNVFNSSYAVRVRDRFDVPGFGEPLFFNEPRTIRLGARYTF